MHTYDEPTHEEPELKCSLCHSPTKIATHRNSFGRPIRTVLTHYSLNFICPDCATALYKKAQPILDQLDSVLRNEVTLIRSRHHVVPFTPQHVGPDESYREDDNTNL